MIGAVTKYRVALPPRAGVLVLAAALQESKLTNIPPGEGDRDSVGVLQQRPSQGWGGGKDSARSRTSARRPRSSSSSWSRSASWQTMPLAQAVQAVQISADGSAYAQHESEAQALRDALRGAKPAGITCNFGKPTKVAAAGGRGRAGPHAAGHHHAGGR